MTNQKPIEPLPSRELVQQWRYAASNKAASITGNDGRFDYIDYIATQAAQWGFNQRCAVNEAELQKARDEELEACCEVLARELICDGKHVATDLRAVRRPKPPSLKAQALDLLDRIEHNAMAKNLGNEKAWDIKELEVVRRLIEAASSRAPEAQ